MSKNNLDSLFKSLEDDFDIEAPNFGHESRFLDKLNSQNGESHKVVKLSSNIWKPLFSIAASIVLLIAILIGFNQKEAAIDLATVSP